MQSLFYTLLPLPLCSITFPSTSLSASPSSSFFSHLDPIYTIIFPSFSLPCAQTISAFHPSLYTTLFSIPYLYLASLILTQFTLFTLHLNLMKFISATCIPSFIIIANSFFISRHPDKLIYAFQQILPHLQINIFTLHDFPEVPAHCLP